MSTGSPQSASREIPISPETEICLHGLVSSQHMIRYEMLLILTQHLIIAVILASLIIADVFPDIWGMGSPALQLEL